ncbi:MAG: ABC transporter permease subunit [Oscillospiraceae bacterium]|nr:ABC transporter permease subunit [Oscillospiraceae bacterium]
MSGLQIAFKKFSPRLGIWGSPWVGFGNFTKFFSSYMFSRVLGNTLTISLYSLVAGFPTPILLALMLNSMLNQRYKRFIQTITYIPHFISVVVMVGILLQMLNPRIGVAAIGFRKLFGREMTDLFAQPNAFANLYVWSGIWQGIGWGSIIYIAALSSIDPELHEAAQIDGASRVGRIWHIDLPGLMPTAIILLILNTGSIMNVGFEKVFLMMNDLNVRSSEVISTYVYKVGLAANRVDYSFATAIGVFNSVVNFLLIVSVNAISRRVSETSLW